MHRRTASRVRILPLLGGTVQISLMEEIAQALFEARLRGAADERADVCRAEVAIASEKLEYLDVASRQLKTTPGRRSLHPGSPLAHAREYHRGGFAKTRSMSVMFTYALRRCAMFLHHILPERGSMVSFDIEQS